MLLIEDIIRWNMETRYCLRWQLLKIVVGVIKTVFAVCYIANIFLKFKKEPLE